MTTQRQLILNAVKNCYCHPNATEVYDMVRQEHSISLATVYNSLNYLSEKGYIMRVAIAGEPDRFDGNTFEHQHAICDKCGKVMRYAPDTKIRIYVHPHGDIEYELCSECTKELRKWLDNNKKLKHYEE